MVRINGEDVSADGKILKRLSVRKRIYAYNDRGRAQWEILPKAQYETAVLNRMM